MKITASQLRKIVAEEIQRQKDLMSEGTLENPVKITPEYLNRIIREEYEALKKSQILSRTRSRRNS